MRDARNAGRLEEAQSRISAPGSGRVSSFLTSSVRTGGWVRWVPLISPQARGADPAVPERHHLVPLLQRRRRLRGHRKARTRRAARLAPLAPSTRQQTTLSHRVARPAALPLARAQGARRAVQAPRDQHGVHGAPDGVEIRRDPALGEAQQSRGTQLGVRAGKDADAHPLGQLARRAAASPISQPRPPHYSPRPVAFALCRWTEIKRACLSARATNCLFPQAHTVRHRRANRVVP